MSVHASTRTTLCVEGAKFSREQDEKKKRSEQNNNKDDVRLCLAVKCFFTVTSLCSLAFSSSLLRDVTFSQPLCWFSTRIVRCITNTSFLESESLFVEDDDVIAVIGHARTSSSELRDNFDTRLLCSLVRAKKLPTSVEFGR